MATAKKGGPIEDCSYIYVIERDKFSSKVEKSKDGKAYQQKKSDFKEMAGPTKIGFDKNIHKRMSLYKTHSAIPVKLRFSQVLFSDDARYIEDDCHTHFRNKLWHGEWYDMHSYEATNYIIERLKKDGVALFESSSIGNWSIFFEERYEEYTQFVVWKNELLGKKDIPEWQKKEVPKEPYVLYKIESTEEETDEKVFNLKAPGNSKLIMNNGYKNRNLYTKRKITQQIYDSFEKCFINVNYLFWKKRYPNEKYPERGSYPLMYLFDQKILE